MVKWLAATFAVAVVVPLGLVLLVAAVPAAGQPAVVAGGPSVLALTTIPPAYLAWYQAAARTCPGLAWGVLAGIGMAESDHGRSTAPGVHAGANFAGAEGPMQFEPATFAQYAIDGDHDHHLSPYDPGDAVFTAANLLCASGAAAGTPTGIRQAVYAYNHSWVYVDQVLAWAARYTTATVPAAAVVAVRFALAQTGKPYRWGATGPGAYDCSGLVYAAYAAAGIQIARTTFGWRQDGPPVPLTQLEPGDLLFSAGSDGTPADPGHVVMYLGGGQVIQAPQAGQDVQADPLSLAGVVAATRPADLPRHP